MSRVAYVVGTAREAARLRKQGTMEPGVELLVPLEQPAGRRWERIIVGHGFNERMRDASPRERAILQSWLKDAHAWLVAGGEMMGSP